MAHFTTAPIADVVPKKKAARGPSQRAQTQQRYRDALQDALGANKALVLELEPDDKALTIRNRIRRAVTTLGVDDVAVRRRGDRIVAYRDSASS
jgi:hypothetical protein